MGGTDGIDVVFQHDADVLLHHFLRDGIAIFRVGLVPVNAPEADGLPIDANQVGIVGAALKPAGRRGLIGDFAEAHLSGFINRSAPAVLLQHQRIEVRVFGAPLAGLGHGNSKGNHLLLARRCRPGGDRKFLIQGNLLPLTVQQVQGDFPGLGISCVIFNRRFHLEGAVHKSAVEIGDNGIVPHPGLRSCVAVHIPENAGQVKEVLVFQPGAITPAVHLDSNGVFFPHADVIRDVKFIGGEGILPIPNLNAVDPEIEGGVNPLKVQINPPSCPVRRNLEAMAIQTDGVIHRWCFGQVTGIANVLVSEIAGEFLSGIGIDGVVIALGLPDRGDENFIPVGIIKILPIKFHIRSCVKVGRAVIVGKLPLGLAQKQIIGGQGFVIVLRRPHCRPKIPIGDGIGSGRLPADGHNVAAALPHRTGTVAIPFRPRPADRIAGKGQKQCGKRRQNKLSFHPCVLLVFFLMGMPTNTLSPTRKVYLKSVVPEPENRLRERMLSR